MSAKFRLFLLLALFGCCARAEQIELPEKGQSAETTYARQDLQMIDQQNLLLQQQQLQQRLIEELKQTQLLQQQLAEKLKTQFPPQLNEADEEAESTDAVVLKAINLGELLAQKYAQQNRPQRPYRRPHYPDYDWDDDDWPIRPPRPARPRPTEPRPSRPMPSPPDVDYGRPPPYGWYPHPYPYPPPSYYYPRPPYGNAYGYGHGYPHYGYGYGQPYPIIRGTPQGGAVATTMLTAPTVDPYAAALLAAASAGGMQKLSDTRTNAAVATAV